MWGLLRRSKRLIGVVLIFIALIVLLLKALTARVWTSNGAIRYMEVPNQSIELRVTQDNLRYLVIGDETKPPMILIHGGFGGFRHWKQWAQVQTIYEQYHLIIPERPGYSPNYRSIEPLITQEANLLAATIEDKTQVTVFGISYGAAPGVELCRLLESDCALLVAGAGALVAEHQPEVSWITDADNGVVKTILPHVFRSALQENLTKTDALAAIEAGYQQITVPVLLFHARDDTTISYRNSEVFLNMVRSEDKMLIYTDGVRHQLQEAIPELLYEAILATKTKRAIK